MKTRYIFLPFLLILVLFSSCSKDLEEMNQDPNGFTTASEGSLFNGVIQSLVLSGNEQFYIQNEVLYKQMQLAALTQSAWGNESIGIEDMWANYYGTLTEIRELERRFSILSSSTPGLNNMKAMVMIVRAYKTFKLTDYFGDIPFSEAGYGFQNVNLLHPRYDRQRDIYLSLLADLKWADENIDESDVANPFETFASFDNLFDGDLKLWRKFANSMRLRYALRMSEKEPVLAGNIIKEVLDQNRPVLTGYNINPVLESACLWPARIGFKNTALNWSFREHKHLRMGSNIWHQLSVNDSLDGSGIFDPRAYIFFETNSGDQWKAYPQIPDVTTPASGGIPYGEHRDDIVNYFLKGECLYSPFNYFLIRDENYIPIILMTGAEVHFLKAEAYFRGIGVAMDKTKGEEEYMNGINASVDWWKMVSNSSQLPLSGLKFPDMVPIPPSLNVSSILEHFGMWNAGSEDQKLRFIYAQRWLDAFRQPGEAYAEARRTGKTPREGDPIHHYRLSYPQSEAIYNTQNWQEAVSRQGGDGSSVKIWWIP